MISIWLRHIASWGHHFCLELVLFPKTWIEIDEKSAQLGTLMFCFPHFVFVKELQGKEPNKRQVCKSMTSYFMCFWLGVHTFLSEGAEALFTWKYIFGRFQKK